MIIIRNAIQNILLTLALLGGLTACAASPSARLLIPSSGQGAQAAKIQVDEYALVEQSLDAPNHPSFQARASEAVAMQRAGWLHSDPAQAVEGPNRALAQFGYHLALNPSPPFSAYALYHDDTLIQRDITRFWTVTDSQASNQTDQSNYLLAFEALDGRRMFVSQFGIQPWTGPARTGSDGAPTSLSGLDGALASADISSGMVSEAGPLYTGGAGIQARQPNASPLRDGDVVLYRQTVVGQPLTLFSRGGIIHLSLGERILPYTYDQVVHDNPSSLAMFNPGSASGLVWFYALRDGLWYYVEVGPAGE